MSTSISFNPTTPSLSPKTLAPNRNPNSPTSLRFPPLRSSPSSTLTLSSSNLKSRLAGGDPLYGIFLLSDSPTIAEIAALSGYDYAVVDMEHGPSDIPRALSLLRSLSAASTPGVLRLPDTTAAAAKKALDLGPAGIMFPMIDSAAAAEEAVSFCRYPPRGVRGAAHTVVRASAYGIDDGYLSRIEDDLLIMCQVESAKGVENIEEIANVEGVDCIQMGPLDLSASMGYLWDPGNRKVRALMKEAEMRVLGVTKKKGVYLGGFAMPHDKPEDLKMRGYHMVAGAVDIGMFRKAAVEDVKRFREAVTEIGEEGDDDDEKTKEEGYWSE